MSQVRGEMHRVLSGAATDFKNLCSIRKSDPQHLEYRTLVALAGFREGQHGHMLQ